MKKSTIFLVRRKHSLFSLLVILLLNSLLFPAVASAQSATVTTNRQDYSPGQTVIITGTNWKPGEQVVLKLTETPIIHRKNTCMLLLMLLAKYTMMNM
jgi:hypothetical protein